jgi:arylsulfatase A-like enzyme
MPSRQEQVKPFIHRHWSFPNDLNAFGDIVIVQLCVFLVQFIPHGLMTSYRHLLFAVLLGVFLVPFPVQAAPDAGEPERPNILFAFADDWGRHASAYGTEGIETPTFDRLAKRGVGFKNAFVPVPSCTPVRGSILTGQHPWRLGPGANLHSTLPAELPVYPWMLEEQQNYVIGHQPKGWGPGDYKAGGRTKRPAGPRYDSFEAFMKERPDDRPFCFWFGTTDPHRPYSDDLRKKMGIDPSDVDVPPYLPDVPVVRKDIANYYAEVQRFDRQVGQALERLEEAGELENTLVVMTGDHGMPFPRAKSNLYDAGTHVALAIAGPMVAQRDEMVTDFVSLVDLGPTFLEAAGVSPTDGMTGRSLMDILTRAGTGQVAAHRSHVITGKERHHGLARPGGKGYPSRAIRTENYLYIRNYKPNRWPAGAPNISSSQWILSDQGDGPTKRWMIEHANDPGVRELFRLSFAKRPAEELYHVKEDPYQMDNLAEQNRYQPIKHHLSRTLTRELRALGDPRETGAPVTFDEAKYRVGYGSEKVEVPEPVKKALNLDQ